MKAPANHFRGNGFPGGIMGTFSGVDGYGWMDIITGSYRDGFRDLKAAIRDALRYQGRV